MIGKQIQSILDKCEIRLEGQVISEELLLQSFVKFLNNSIDSTYHTGIVLHTGSVCFDALAIVWAAFVAIVGNNIDVEQIIRSLEIGSVVLYENERGEFQGFETEKGEERAVIGQGNGKRKLIGKIGWSKIVPYQGDSKRYDGRGIRTKNGVREKFLAEVLKCDIKDIPGITDTSVILVMDRHKADRYMSGLEIECGNMIIPIRDLVTASYFTDGNEYPYGGNIGKNEAMLKFTSKISVGLDMTWETEGNEHLGMFVCGNSLIERGNESMEISQMMKRETLRFSFICGSMDLSCGENLAVMYEKSGIFACTKDFLLENTLPPRNRNKYTLELERQVDAIIDREIRTEILPGEINWQDYKNFKTAIGLILRDELDDDEKSDIVIPARSLMKLFMTAPFSINEMEKEIEEGKIEVENPLKMLEELEKRLVNLPSNLRGCGEKISDVLETAYYSRCDGSPKYGFVKQYVNERVGKKLAIVVPKAYYADIMWDCVFDDCNMDTSNIEIVSVNRFDGSRTYDSILLVGDIIGKRFDAFRCTAAPEIMVLLYEPEAIVFRAKERKGSERDILFNLRQQVSGETIEISQEDELLKEGEVVDQVDDEISRYTDDIISIKFDQAICQENGNLSAPPSEVATLVRFENGEGAMLTKRYEAYVLNNEKGEVEQRKADGLKVGDDMIFLNRDNDTRDIVDYVLKELIRSNRLGSGFAERYAMARRWKTDLAEYMKRTGETPKQIVDKMIANGVSVQPVTIKNWLDEDTRTVAPQKVEHLSQIALLTENAELFDHAEEYFSACRDVRRVRKNILKELGTAILRRIEGGDALDGIIPLEIQERLDTMAVVLRIETIIKTDKLVPAYMTNRPIDLDGGL